MKKIEFDGKKIEYDEKAFDNWRVQRGFACGIEKPVAFYDAIDIIFGGPGKSDEVSDMFDGSTTKVMEVLDLITAEINKAGGTGKN